MTKIVDSPPKATTGRDVKTRLHSRMKVYWYKYVASKLGKR